MLKNECRAPSAGSATTAWFNKPISFGKLLNDAQMFVSVVVRRLIAGVSSKNVGILIFLNTPKCVGYACNWSPVLFVQPV